MKRPLFHRCLAETAGTAILVYVGTGAVVVGAKLGGLPQVELAVAWFAAVAIPVLLFAGVSGAHLNPAVTLALTVARRASATEVPAYLTAQFGGALGGSFLVGLTVGTGAHWGATLPWNGEVTLVPPLESVFTAALVLAVLFLTAEGKVPSKLELLLPAGVVGVSTLLIGPWTGSSLNPARTVAPAVFSGDYLGIWAYLTVVPAAAVATAFVFRRRASDHASRLPLDGGPEAEEGAPLLGRRSKR